MLVTSVLASLGFSAALAGKCLGMAPPLKQMSGFMFCGSARNLLTGITLGTGPDFQQMLVCESFVLRQDRCDFKVSLKAESGVCVRALAACGCA